MSNADVCANDVNIALQYKTLGPDAKEAWATLKSIWADEKGAFTHFSEEVGDFVTQTEDEAVAALLVLKELASKLHSQLRIIKDSSITTVKTEVL